MKLLDSKLVNLLRISYAVLSVIAVILYAVVAYTLMLLHPITIPVCVFMSVVLLAYIFL